MFSKLIEEIREVLAERGLNPGEFPQSNEVDLPRGVHRDGIVSPGWVLMRQDLLKAGYKGMKAPQVDVFVKGNVGVTCIKKRSPTIRTSDGSVPPDAAVHEIMAIAHSAAAKAHSQEMIAVQAFDNRTRQSLKGLIKKQGWTYARLDAGVPPQDDIEKIIMLAGVKPPDLVSVLRSSHLGNLSIVDPLGKVVQP